MIDITQLTEFDKGRGVVYRSMGGDKIEDGVISSWNDKFVFVVYSGSRQSAATRPEDLEWEFKKEGPGNAPDPVSLIVE